MLQTVLMTLSMAALAQGHMVCRPVQVDGAREHACASTESAAKLTTFIPVCRDRRGTWDRRACRHVGRYDPARLSLA